MGRQMRSLLQSPAESNCASPDSNLQIEQQKPVVLVYAAVFFAKLPVELPIMLGPPERRPREGNVSGASAAQPLQLADRRRTICWWTPVFPVLFQERNRSRVRQVVPHLLVIHQNERLGQRYEPRECIPAFLQSPDVGLAQGFRRSADGGGHARLHKDCEQRRPVDGLHRGPVEPTE